MTPPGFLGSATGYKPGFTPFSGGPILNTPAGGPSGAAFTPYTGAPLMFNGGTSDYGGSFGAPMSLTGGGSQIMPPGGAPAPYGAATGTSQSGGSYIDPLKTQSWFDMGANGQPNWHTPSSAATGAVDSFLSGGQGGPTAAPGGGLSYGQTGSSGQMNANSYYTMPGGGTPGSFVPGAVDAAHLQDYKQNPYMNQMVQGLQTQFNNNLNLNTLPALRGGAAVAGGVGGSREGIAQGLAAGQSNTGLANAMSNLYGSDYEQQMGRNLQQYGMDQNFNLGAAGIGAQAQGMANQYDLGRRGVDLGYLNANNSYNLGMGGLANQRQGIDNSYALGNQGQMLDFYNNQRGQDIQSQLAGANISQMGMNDYWNNLNNYNSLLNGWSGFGNTNQTNSQGGGAMGALGGGLGGYSIWNALMNGG